MKQQSYIKNAAILTATGLFLRGAGMLFRIYIAGRIGAEGMGLYQLVLTVYNLAVTVSTAGLTVCATRIATDAFAKNSGTQSAMARVIRLGIVLGSFCALVLFLSAEIVSRYSIRDMRAVLALKVLAPSLPFMAISACLRGYFISRRSVVPNAKAQIFEQFVRIAFVAVLIDIAVPIGISTACAAVTAGNTVSEICSWVYMWHSYRKDCKGEGGIGSNGGIGHNGLGGIGSNGGISIAHVLMPIAANQYVSAFLRTFENIIIPSCLTAFTHSRETSLAQFGALKGMAMPVIFFPFSFLLTLSTLLLPEITDAFIRKQNKAMEHLISRVMLITCVLSVAMGGVFAMFAKEIGLLLYKSEEIGFYIAVLGPLAPFMYIESMVDSILKGMDEQLSTFKYSMFDCISRIILIYILVPRLGMAGFLFVMIYSNLLTGILNIRRLFCVTKIRFNWLAWVIKPILSIALSVAVSHFVLMPLLMLFLPLWGYAVAGAISLLCLFFVLLWLMGGFSIKDLLPKNAKLSL
ncbi:MAG: polysaccharide biosynthesis C-terminal domain-containing protein [Oscillospiraceae bacterium]